MVMSGGASQPDNPDSIDDLLARHKIPIDDIERLKAILARVPDSDPALPFFRGMWMPQLAIWRGKATGNQFGTTVFALVDLFFVVPLPLLTGLGALVGPQANWLRWMTFGLSLGAALISRFVAVQAYEPRWVLYHRFSESLFEEAQLYVERAGPYDPSQAVPPLDPIAIKNRFVTNVTELQTDRTNQYNDIVPAASAGAMAGKSRSK
jgi:Protein of unknown function (DUF4231)